MTNLEPIFVHQNYSKRPCGSYEAFSAYGPCSVGDLPNVFYVAGFEAAERRLLLSVYAFALGRGKILSLAWLCAARLT